MKMFSCLEKTKLNFDKMKKLNRYYAVHNQEPGKKRHVKTTEFVQTTDSGFSSYDSCQVKGYIPMLTGT